jgi:hypothetical protein
VKGIVVKEVINIYKKNKLAVDNYIVTLINSLPKDYIENADMILNNNEYIQLIYAVDSDYKQVSPVICRKHRDKSNINSNKAHYFTKLALDENGIYISNPYIHYRTGKASLSAVVFTNNTYYVFDINLIGLLETLRLIEYNRAHNQFKKVVYTVGASLLAIVALLLILYGGYKFISHLIYDADKDFLKGIFESIIAITLGLAIYDLAKQIFEHEVLFSSFDHSEGKQYKMLGKFLISIIIALSIETLMVVFKIALSDYSQMLSAFYLIIGVTIMFVGVGYFYKTIKLSSCDEDDIHYTS